MEDKNLKEKYAQLQDDYLDLVERHHQSLRNFNVIIKVKDRCLIIVLIFMLIQSVINIVL
ncbi:MAG: hypothetical protein IKU01_02340 [Bacteroidales bacterium]|nr:hypothetical protein [Bacteroidales bacterium]